MASFGDRLKELRERKGFSQAQLAAAIGGSIWTIRNHEQNKSGLSSDDLFTYCRLLGVSCSEFQDCLSKPTAAKKKVAIVKRKAKGK